MLYSSLCAEYPCSKTQSKKNWTSCSWKSSSCCLCSCPVLESKTFHYRRRPEKSCRNQLNSVNLGVKNTHLNTKHFMFTSINLPRLTGIPENTLWEMWTTMDNSFSLVLSHRSQKTASAPPMFSCSLHSSLLFTFR